MEGNAFIPAKATNLKTFLGTRLGMRYKYNAGTIMR